MNRVLLRTVGIMGGAFVAVSVASSLCLRAATAVLEKRRAKTAPPCTVCQGKRFYPCQLCRSAGKIQWSPLADPVLPRPCLCPTCKGNKIQKCLNCAGRGYV
ncbi:unnamed protein product [Closterium sp. NIES-53]